MTAEPKRIPIMLPCPNCAKKANVNLTKSDLESALKFGEFDAYHIICNHSWKVRLDDAMKANVKGLIDTEFRA